MISHKKYMNDVFIAVLESKIVNVCMLQNKLFEQHHIKLSTNSAYILCCEIFGGAGRGGGGGGGGGERARVTMSPPQIISGFGTTGIHRGTQRGF